MKGIEYSTVVSGRNVAEQHWITVCRMTLNIKKKRVKAETRVKWWRLKKEECYAKSRKELRQVLDDWESTAVVLRELPRRCLLSLHKGKRSRRLGGRSTRKVSKEELSKEKVRKSGVLPYNELYVRRK